MPAQLIALDLGTSSLRAYKLGPAGVVLEQRALASGIMHLPTEARAIAGVRCTDGFELAFDAACGDWLDAAPHLPVIACGMVGSAQGWSEAAYRNTPVDVASLGQALHSVRSLRGVEVHIVPGVIEQVGLPNVMRGEETQVLGVLQGLGGQMHDARRQRALFQHHACGAEFVSTKGAGPPIERDQLRLHRFT